MKIALFHTTLPEAGRKLGGVEVAVHRLANALADLKAHEVTVFTLSQRPADARYQHHQLFANQSWLKDRRIARLALLPALLNFISFRKFDVIHLHGDDWFYIRRTLPSIRTFHGSALREAQAATSLKRKLVHYLIYPLEQTSNRLSTITLAGGAQTKDIYDAREIMDYGVDSDLFRPGRKLKNPRVLFVGTWEGRKRGKFIFDIFVKKILPAIPHATLCMVSDYCPAHPNVIFERFPDDETLARRYRESWVFAYPSTYEGFGISYVEAMASGTAILTSPNEGARYVLRDGKDGILADDDDFAEELLDLLSNAIRRKKLAANGLQRGSAFSWKNIARRHISIYKQAEKKRL